MDRIDGKGFHPTARPYRPHFKSDRSKLKVMRIALPITKQVEVLWTKFGAFATKNGERVLNKMIDLVVLDSNETALEPMYGGEIIYGAAGDFSGQHADPSRPPPKHGWAQKVMRHAAVLFLAGILAFLAACHKDPTPEPQPNPDNPNDTVVTPPEPIKKNDTLFVNLATSYSFGPSPDTVRAHLNKPNVDCVVIHLFRENGIGYPINCTHYLPGAFHKAREDLQQDIDVDSTRTSLYIIFEVRNINAPDHEWSQQEPGITPYDKAWFESKGAQFVILDKTQSK